MARKEPKEKRISDLLEAAIAEFLEKGYEGASVDAIARRAGVSKGGFYHHFPNKEALLMEANRKLGEPVEEMIRKAWNNPSAIEGLNDYVREYLTYWANRPIGLSFTFLSMSKALQSEVLRDYLKDYVEGTASFFTGMFQRVAEMGEAEIKDPEAYGIALMGALDGVVSYIMVNPRESTDILADRMMQLWIKKE